MSSWSDREKEKGPSTEKIKKGISEVNGVLNHLANDRNLHDDLQDPTVKVALMHWTGEKRLDPNSEVVLGFQDNYRIMSTLGKIQRLQAACRSLGIGVPFDHVVQRKPELDKKFLAAQFGIGQDSAAVKTENKTAAESEQEADKRAKTQSPGKEKDNKEESLYSKPPAEFRESESAPSMGSSGLAYIFIICLVAFAYKFYLEYNTTTG